MIWLLLTAASATEVGAIVRPEVSVDLAADREGEDAAEAITTVRAFAKGDLEDGSRWFLELRADHAVLIGDDVEGHWYATAGEAGWHGDVGPVDIRVGNLVERWGKLDFLSMADIVNPRDLRWGPNLPAEFQRVPIPMATIGMGAAPVRGELTLIPFPIGNRIRGNGTDWAIVRQGMLGELLGEMKGWDGTQFSQAQFGMLFDALENSVENLDPHMRVGLDQALSQQALPPFLFYTGEAVGRIEFEGSGFDAAVMGGNLHTRVRQVELNPKLVETLQTQILPEAEEMENLSGGQALTTSWPRSWVAGAEASTLIGPIGIRAETMFQSHQVVPLRWLRSETVPSLATGVGIDVVHGSNFYAVFEVAHDHLFNPPAQMLMQVPDAFQLAGGVRVHLFAQRVEVQLGGSYFTNYREYFARPTVSWRVSDPLKLELGALLLGGPRPAPDTMLEALVYRGGMAGYFSQNDAVTFAVSWIL